MFYDKLHVLAAMLVLTVSEKITDKEYVSMPSLFHLDNFENCMALGENALYCVVTVQLAPVDSKNSSNVWRVIQEVISHKKNYRHDRLRHGICIPETCPQLSQNISIYANDKQLLKTKISECYTEKYKNVGIKSFVTHMHCETNQPVYAIDMYDVLVGVSLLILFAIVVFGSFYEGLARYKTKEEYIKITTTPLGKVISCFSFPKNWQRLGSLHTTPDAASLGCINGIKFYGTVFVMMSHSSLGAFASMISNPQFLETLTDNPLNMFALNGMYGIQIFFVIAGWLLSYHLFTTFEKQKKVKFSYILTIFANRYIRLTPCLVVVMAFSATWMYHLGSGPLWDAGIGNEYRNCRNNWWTNLLYINNYYDSQHMCMQQSWYLAVDTQLFLLSLAIIIFMLKYQKYIKCILCICLIMGILIPGVINYIYDYDIVIRIYPEPLFGLLLDVPQWHVMYASGYTNVGSYMMGVTFGYIFYKYKEQKLLSKKIYVMIWWILISVPILAVIFVGIPIYEESYKHSRLTAAIYVSLGRSIFAFVAALLIFGLTHGVGWFLRDACSWSPLQILGRLTYCVFLVHVALIRIRASQFRSPTYVSHYILFIQMLGDLMVSYIFATFLCLFVEMPVSALQKLLVAKLETTDKNIVIKKPPVCVNGNNSLDPENCSQVTKL